MDISTFIKLALSFDEATEQPHFDKNSFRVNDKIFATIDTKNLKAVFKLSEVDQSVFSDFDPSAIYPATGAWGKQGWTIFEIKFVEPEMIKDALTLSYCNVAPQKLAAKYQDVAE
ncbi:MmcQ/YjbR family DNA-binding protein [Pedobacter chinensis]|uniref:MmcQ/YjbR family DNA-binding protein n=1 Tax=Pedobacter chinensis TaxID=2282421 RepID=A0A369Q281_9SPHI|nr:MmcQ/YjbR family DNA-binding protein [Pedobacter chinensis]RDC58602.1 MmcQ/YjbR family DNA-binding protein [Pedobacter chinensis]